jgi:hypothetical protein
VRAELDRQMRAVLAQLETCSHVPAPSSSGGGSSSDEHPGGRRPPGDLGHTYWARWYGPPFHERSSAHPGARDDDNRVQIINAARQELEHLRGHAVRERTQSESLDQLRARIVKQGEGWTVEEVARAMRCGERLVIEARKQAGREPTFGRRVERPSEALARDERRRRAEEMREKGMSYRAIGSLLGVDGETIRRDLTLADHGVM